MKVLVVEDDPAVRASLQRCLEFEGYTVVTAADGSVGLATAVAQAPDVVVLDLGLPAIDGLEVCRRLRAGGHGVPILMLTARHSTGERVWGLDAGADDYLPKPFALEELLARLRALVRRAGIADGAQHILCAGDLRMDSAAREVTRAGRPISLTRTEYELLSLLMAHPRQVLARTAILAAVWGHDVDPDTNTLEVFIGYLRRKTEDSGLPRIIHTVRGVGYVLRPHAGAVP
ncbi:response regulator transcription factor [Catellatospora sp. NPDC049609]|uniref:response regulator transcription factor n=1 Tax=Catellatospora sp. NPDC049609 TaxID=3155505 RepID=UPI003436B79A